MHVNESIHTHRNEHQFGGYYKYHDWYHFHSTVNIHIDTKKVKKCKQTISTPYYYYSTHISKEKVDKEDIIIGLQFLILDYNENGPHCWDYYCRNAQ